MRTVSDIYEEYRIPPWLQLHQLRVAAVGKRVAEMHSSTVNVRDVLCACLLHDIGAIVKFDFSRSGGTLDDLYPASDAEYWRGVQREVREKYSELEHPATDAILAEIGVSEAIRDIVHNTGFANMKKIIERDMITAQIVQYADMRIGPHGILTIDERLGDVKERYAEKLKSNGWYEKYDQNIANAHVIEKRLFAGIALTPEEINDAAVVPLIEELRKYAVS